MPVQVHTVDPEVLLQDALSTLQSEIQSLRLDEGEAPDRDEWSKRLDRAIRSVRGLVKESRELQNELRAKYAQGSEIELLRAFLDAPEGLTLVLEQLRERGWTLTDPAQAARGEADKPHHEARKQRRVVMNAMMAKEKTP